MIAESDYITISAGTEETDPPTGYGNPLTTTSQE